MKKQKEKKRKPLKQSEDSLFYWVSMLALEEKNMNKWNYVGLGITLTGITIMALIQLQHQTKVQVSFTDFIPETILLGTIALIGIIVFLYESKTINSII